MSDRNRLDAAESVFFKRQLENIEQTAYQTVYPALKARMLLPSVSCPDWVNVHTFRLYDSTGSAKRIGNGDTNDIPRAEAKGTENSVVIERFASSYAYNIFEIKAAAGSNTPLDAMRAAACRRVLEEQIDDILAVGDGGNLLGLLSSANSNPYVLSTKAAGGLTWGTVGAPNATALEIVADLMGIAESRVAATKEAFNRFTIVLPIAQYNLAAQMPLGADASLTPLQFALKNSPFIEAVVPWYKCAGAGAGAVDRMVCYPKDASVLGALVPMEFTPQAPELRGLEYAINATMSTGGVITRYPVACAYGDGL